MNPLIKIFTRLHKTIFRLSGGKVGGSMVGIPVLLLTTTGRKSGKPYTTPLCYFKNGDEYALIASAGGADKHPSWYLNLKSSPEVEIELEGKKMQARATQASDKKRQQIWDQASQVTDAFDGYQSKTERKIPVVILKPKK